MQDRRDEVDSIKDCVLNRVLMPRDTNLRASDKMPHIYLNDLFKKNPHLRSSLDSHLVPHSLLDDEKQSLRVYTTLYERGEKIMKLIRAETLEAEQAVRTAFVAEASVQPLG